MATYNDGYSLDEDEYVPHNNKEDEILYYNEASLSQSLTEDEETLPTGGPRQSQRTTAGVPPTRYREAFGNLTVSKFAHVVKKLIFIKEGKLPVLGHMSQMSLKQSLKKFRKFAEDGAVKELKQLHDLRMF